jgi:hypothetical protein
MRMKEHLLDKRVVQRALQEGLLDKEVYQRMLDALPDVSHKLQAAGGDGLRASREDFSAGSDSDLDSDLDDDEDDEDDSDEDEDEDASDEPVHVASAEQDPASATEPSES